MEVPEDLNTSILSTPENEKFHEIAGKWYAIKNSGLVWSRNEIPLLAAIFKKSAVRPFVLEIDCEPYAQILLGSEKAKEAEIKSIQLAYALKRSRLLNIQMLENTSEKGYYLIVPVEKIAQKEEVYAARGRPAVLEPLNLDDIDSK